MKLPECVWTWSIIIVCGLYGAKAQLNLDNIDLQNQLPEDFAKTNFSLNEMKDLFRNKCIEVSGEEVGGQAFSDIESGVIGLTECMNRIVNYTAMQKEIDDASPRGELDVVFNKYCKKRTDAIDCFDEFNVKLLPCLDKDEQKSQDVIRHIIQSLLNFVCYKDGDQIALFIAEEGPECLRSQKDNIQECFNSTFSTFLNNSDIHEDNKIKTLPKFVVGQTQCGDIRILESCIVRHLEHCKKITPANLIESMFNFIRNETVCRNYHPLPLTGSASMLSNNPIFSILITSKLIFILVKMYYSK
ncbi:27 kDa hemolymph protein [Drosophila innubila]|uniref:27 kDa hemolymph protein n=1 Tax=Drosophila innubila TaxID=198719 RepID=UPI00148DBBE6|nr:27 kDa hemolymph protein [Drosophila innubila]XP_034489729.1 27 kDa hemolymph protein [Drosophila innubila]